MGTPHSQTLRGSKKKDDRATLVSSSDISQSSHLSIFDRRCCTSAQPTSAPGRCTIFSLCIRTFSALLPCINFLSRPNLGGDTAEISVNTTWSVRLCGHGAIPCLMQHPSRHQVMAPEISQAERTTWNRGSRSTWVQGCRQHKRAIADCYWELKARYVSITHAMVIDKYSCSNHSRAIRCGSY